MVNGKRVIGIFVGKADNEDSIAYIRELSNHAKECDYIPVVYNLIADFNETGVRPEFDYSILHVLNFEYVDGVVVIKDGFMPVSLVDAIIAYAKEHDKARVVIGAHHEDAYSIEYQGYDSYETIVNHVVKDHGCRNVYFLGDETHTNVLDSCLETYKRVLSNNDINCSEDKIAIADAFDTIDNIITRWIGSGEMPEAIVCDSDIVAMDACRVLGTNGYLVPDNVIVSGYNYEEKSKVYYPKLTSTYKDIHTMSELIMELLGESFASGYNGNMVIKQQLQVKFSQSCGCERSSVAYFSNVTSGFSSRINSMENYLSYLFELTGKMSEKNSIEQLSEIFSQYINSDSYMVLRNSIWNTEVPDQLEPSYDESVTVIRANSNPLTDQRMVFPLGVYTADMDTIDQEDCVRSIFLLHFKNTIYGYYVTKCKFDITNAARHSRFVDISNVNLNGVFNRHKLRIASEKLVELQVRDSLTGVYNFKGFERRVENGYFNKKNNRKLMIFAFDIDDFSAINEKYGHSEGDKALVALADIIRASASAEDCLARSGADEYVLAMATVEDVDYIIYNFMSSFYQSLKNYNSINDNDYELKVSVANTVGEPNNLAELNALIEEAVAKKNQHKRSDKQLVTEEVDEEEVRDYEQLKRLIDTNSFDYMFQPIISAYTGEIFGYEALMRSVNGIQLSPVRIIELATKYDRLSEIEYATVKNVYEKVWNNKEKFKNRKIFMNSILGHTLGRDEAELVIGEYRDLTPNVVVEITEQSDIPEDEYVEYIALLKQAGNQIAIDDFGTGYSNTSRIIEYVPHYVKIDRSLITGINSDYRKQHFVNNIIQYAHENGFMALAEGVETVLELKCVIRMGVDLIQGYYTARPSFEILDKISDETIRLIITNSAKRLFPDEPDKMLVANGRDEISLEEFRSEDMRQIYIAKEELSIIGDGEATFCNINIGDGYEGTIVLKDAFLKSGDAGPVIGIGNNSKVYLQFEGHNHLQGGGIFVPETSSVHIVGGGDLMIENANQKVVGIGGQADTAYGNVNIDLPGGIEMIFAADTAIGIGGGYNTNGRSIVINNTPIVMKPAVANLLGIGSIFDEAKVYVNDSQITIKAGVRLFVGLGSVRSDPFVQIVRSKLIFDVGGNNIWTIGTFGRADSSISIMDSEIDFEIHGKNNLGIGAESGNCQIKIGGTTLSGIIEGAVVTFVGVKTKEGSIVMTDNTIDVEISSENEVKYSVEPKNLVFINE